MSNERILIVEDERIVALGLQKKLQNLGYGVAGVAATGAEAIQQAEQTRPNLVLMDMRLEGDMDGVTAAAQIRQRFQIPAVYLTAYSDAITLQRAKATEPLGYILKPYQDRELQVVLEMALFKHRLERQLHERERWFTATLRSIGDAVIAADAAQRIAFLNPKAEALTGWRQEEAVGRDVSEVVRLVHEETRLPIESPLARALQEGTPIGRANRALLLAKDQREVPVDDCAAPIKDDEGRIIGAVLSFRDVTEARRLQEHVRQSHKMEAVSQLAGGVAHDFNNIMTIVLGYAELLLRGLPPDGSQAEMVRQIKKNSERAAALTQQLLAFGRKQMLRPVPLNLNALLSDMEKRLAHRLGETIELQFGLDPQLRPVLADPVQIQQVILNLVSNAAEAMPTGGRLTITTDLVVLAENGRSVPEAPAGVYVQLALTDTGAGMEERVKARIFEPFFSTKEFGKGTGLGLATVHGIVNQSGGFIVVDSERGLGTTFTLYFPVAGELPKSAPSSPDLASLPRGHETVLLVEDEEAVRSLTRLLLEEQGYTVLEARQGEEALARFQQHAGPIDLVITDVVMPRMSGWQLAQRVEAIRPGTRVLFVSGFSDEFLTHADRTRAGEAFLEKPFTLTGLAKKIREVLGR